MKLIQRNYQSEEDYWRIRTFLREVMLQNQRREWSWHVARLDYWYWFVNADLEKLPVEEQIIFWETEYGEIAAVLTAEAAGLVHPNIHPDFATNALLQEVIQAAEERMQTTAKDGRRKLWFYADSKDSDAHTVLSSRGFCRVEDGEYVETQHRRSLDEALPELPQIPGYTIRSLGAGLEFLERCYASGLGFHQDDIAVARDNRDHPEWYHHIQSAPLYRRDLDLVAVADDGSITAFCTIWFDDFSRTAYFEPVATVPAHQRKGLGKAVMIEGLHRLKAMGCKVAFVGGYSQAANALYFSVMGADHDVSEPWEKVLDHD
ncbi:MAG: GNAT family N-acetyltransferase [Chloroflexi bacterium HGW-Chloroflexi-10]|nr:MAG: GNAT family N-acetyltransferase [Chloroflexi bacterium HGW-Chloroflexi-10]